VPYEELDISDESIAFYLCLTVFTVFLLQVGGV